MQSLFFFCFLLLLFGSCGSIDSNSSDTGYYHTSTWLQQQEKALIERKGVLFKIIRVNNTTDTVTQTGSNWNREFTLLYETDISKLALKGAYQTDTFQMANSRLRMLYQLKKGEKGIVKRLEVDKKKDELLRVYAVLEQEGIFYLNRSIMTMLAGENGLLKSYRIQTRQSYFGLYAGDIDIKAEIR